jgi:hypothetical protein
MPCGNLRTGSIDPSRDRLLLGACETPDELQTTDGTETGFVGEDAPGDTEANGSCYRRTGKATYCRVGIEGVVEYGTEGDGGADTCDVADDIAPPSSCSVFLNRPPKVYSQARPNLTN